MILLCWVLGASREGSGELRLSWDTARVSLSVMPPSEPVTPPTILTISITLIKIPQTLGTVSQVNMVILVFCANYQLKHEFQHQSAILKQWNELISYSNINVWWNSLSFRIKHNSFPEKVLLVEACLSRIMAEIVIFFKNCDLFEIISL